MRVARLGRCLFTDPPRCFFKTVPNQFKCDDPTALNVNIPSGEKWPIKCQTNDELQDFVRYKRGHSSTCLFSQNMRSNLFSRTNERQNSGARSWNVGGFRFERCGSPDLWMVIR